MKTADYQMTFKNESKVKDLILNLKIVMVNIDTGDLITRCMELYIILILILYGANVLDATELEATELDFGYNRVCEHKQHNWEQ